MKYKRHKMLLKTKLVIFVCLITVSLTAIVSAVVIKGAKDFGTQLIGAKGLTMLKTINLSIDGDRIDSLIKSKKKNVFYERTRKYLNKVNRNTKPTYLYIIAFKDSKNYQYVVDSTNPQSKDFCDFGSTDSVDVYPAEAKKALQTGKSGVSKIYDAGKWGRLVSAFCPIKDSEGRTVALLGCDFSATKVNKEIQFLFTQLIIVGLLLVVIFNVIAVIILRQQFKPLNMVIANMKKAAMGDLTVRIDNAGNDEIGALGESFNKMVLGQRNLIADVAKSSMIVEKGTENIGTSIKDIVASTESQVSSIKEFSSAIEDVGKGIDNTSSSIQKIAREMEVIAKSVDNLNAKIDATMALSTNGEDTMVEAVGKFQNTRKDSDKLIYFIVELNDKSTSIKNIVETIKKISSQINILSLNATIEASRTSGTGQGFVVVADQIRDLAEQTNVAITQISDTVANIEEGIAKVKEESELVMKLISESDVLVSGAEVKFKGIYDNVRDISDDGKEINAVIVNVNNDIGTISQTIEHQVACLEEVLTSADVIGDGISHVAEDNEKISVAVGDMIKDSSKLVDVVNKFKVQ